MATLPAGQYLDTYTEPQSYIRDATGAIIGFEDSSGNIHYTVESKTNPLTGRIIFPTPFGDVGTVTPGQADQIIASLAGSPTVIAPWLALTSQSDYLTQHPDAGAVVSAPGRDLYESPSGYAIRLSNASFGLDSLYPTITADLANYAAITGVAYTGIELWSGNGAEIMFGVGSVPNPGTASMTNFFVPGVTSGNRPNRLLLPIGQRAALASPNVPYSAGIDLYPSNGWRLSMRTATAVNIQARLTQTKFSHAIFGFNPTTGVALSDDLLTGAAGVQSLDYTNTVKYPSGIDGIVLQMYDTTGASCRWSSDGVSPSTARGRYLASGAIRYVDFAQHGISLSNLKFYLSATQTLRVHAIARMP